MQTRLMQLQTYHMLLVVDSPAASATETDLVKLVTGLVDLNRHVYDLIMTRLRLRRARLH